MTVTTYAVQVIVKEEEGIMVMTAVAAVPRVALAAMTMAVGMEVTEGSTFKNRHLTRACGAIDDREGERGGGEGEGRGRAGEHREGVVDREAHGSRTAQGRMPILNPSRFLRGRFRPS